MGLLTDPGVERSAVPAMLERHHRPVCLLLYVAGITWFLALAYNPFNHGTYFSENALLPGLVQGDFHGDSKARNYLASLNAEAERNRQFAAASGLTQSPSVSEPSQILNSSIF